MTKPWRMKRVPLDLACYITGVKPGTIRRWVHDGNIVRYPDGYDVRELIGRMDERNEDALRVQRGETGEHATRLRRSA
jgi:hypothetical protein